MIASTSTSANISISTNWVRYGRYSIRKEFIASLHQMIANASDIRVRIYLEQPHVYWVENGYRLKVKAGIKTLDAYVPDEYIRDHLPSCAK